MSFHLLHITSPDKYLYQKLGSLYCKDKKDESSLKKFPIEDLKAIIIATRGVTLSTPLIASLAKENVPILHCDDKFIPIAWTVSLSQVIDKQVAFNQIEIGSFLHRRIWKKILEQKTRNQMKCLQNLNCDTAYFSNALKQKQLNESSLARVYWNRYFKALGEKNLKREQTSNNPINLKLNYAYTVLASLCHRSIIIHGLQPQFGIFHKSRYRSFPLVYDLMEVFRPFIDQNLYYFETCFDNKNNLEDWIKYCAKFLYEQEVVYKDYKLKLIDAVDYYISSVAQTFAKKKLDKLFLPSLI